MESISFSNGIAGGIDSRIGGRTENQDHFEIAETPVGPLIVVCDGMGGGPSGKTASSMAAKCMVGFMQAVVPGENPAKALNDAIIAANNALNDAIADNPTMAGMGTTCVCVLFCGNTAYIGHVGDSRCYLLRNGKIKFRTADHSQVADLVRQGVITEEQARTSAYSNIITRGIGIQPKVEPEIDRVSVKKGDRIALMTDGIWGAMSESILVAELTSSTADAVARSLPERIDNRGKRKGGGHDNMTLAAVDVMRSPKDLNLSKGAAQPATNYESHAAGRRTVYSGKMGLVVVGCILLGALLGVGAYYIFDRTAKDSTTASVPKIAVESKTDNINADVVTQPEPTVPVQPAMPESPAQSSSQASALNQPTDNPLVTQPSTAVIENLATVDAEYINEVKAIIKSLENFRDYTPKDSKGRPYNPSHQIPERQRNALIEKRQKQLMEIVRKIEAVKVSDVNVRAKLDDVRNLFANNRAQASHVCNNYGKASKDAMNILNPGLETLGDIVNLK